MNNLRFLVIAIILFPFFSNAEEVSSLILKDNDDNCASMKEMIISDISKPMECFIDDDCQYFDYGYPFQNDVCMKAEVSTHEKDKLLRHLKNIDKYVDNCVSNIDSEQKQYSEFNEKLEAEKNNKSCSMLRLMCYKGYCRNSTYVIYNEQ